MLEFERAVFEDCQRKKLLRKKDNFEKNINNKKIMAVIIYICIILGFFYFPDMLNCFKLNLYIVLPAFVIMVFLFILIFTYPMIAVLYLKGYQNLNKLNPYIRNKKAKEINLKLNGLKKFLNDYSQIEEKKKDDLILWEDYLIYSIIFDLNDNVVKEVMGKIQ